MCEAQYGPDYTKQSELPHPTEHPDRRPQPSSGSGAAYVAAVRQASLRPSCVQSAFGPADARVAPNPKAPHGWRADLYRSPHYAYARWNWRIVPPEKAAS